MALTQVTSAGLKDGEIVNADLHSAAAIALSKLATSGTAGSGNYLRGDGAWSAIDLSTKLNLTGGTLTGNVIHNDSVKALFGTGSDLQIYHDGSASYIKNTTGNLVISDTDGDIHIQAKDGEHSIVALTDGAVKLYHNNVAKLETNSTGIDVTGDVHVGDSSGYGGSADNLFSCGASDDLKIYHHGSWGASYINNSGSSALFLESDDIRFRKADGQELYFKAVADGAVELYYDNAKKLETTSGGVIVQGQLAVAGSAISLSLADSGKAAFGNGDDLQIYHDGVHSFIRHDGGGSLLIKTDAADEDIYIDAGQSLHLRTTTSFESAISCIANGAVELYYDNSKKLNTNANGVHITDTLSFANTGSSITLADDQKLTFGTGNDCEIYGIASAGTSAIINHANGDLLIKHGADKQLISRDDGAVELYFDDVLKLATTSSGIKISDSTLEIADTTCLIDLMETGATDGNHRIRNGSGNFYVQHITDDKSTTRDQLKIDGGTGVVELYHSGNKKLETTSDGINVDGFVYATRLDLDDNEKILLGTGDDLQIYHNGTHSFLENSNGGLYGRSDEILLQSNTGNENYLIATLNGAVELYYDNVKKFETTSGGAQVTGNMVADAFYLGDNEKLYCGTGDDLQIWHDGSNTNIKNTTGWLNIYAGGNGFSIGNGDFTENLFKATNNGSVELYYDNSKKLETYPGGVEIVGDCYLADNKIIKLGNSSDLQIYHSGDDSFLKDTGVGGIYICTNQFLVRNAAADEIAIQALENGAVELYYDNSKKFETNSNGIRTYGRAMIDGHCQPQVDNNNELGGPSNRWTTVYATNSSINTSDKNEKNTIVKSDLGLHFINKLKPVSYKWNKDDGKTHYGLIAQDIEETLSTEGKTDKDFAGLHKPTEGPMGLSYTELISPLIKAVQELSEKVAALEAG